MNKLQSTIIEFNSDVMSNISVKKNEQFNDNMHSFFDINDDVHRN